MTYRPKLTSSTQVPKRFDSVSPAKMNSLGEIDLQRVFHLDGSLSPPKKQGFEAKLELKRREYVRSSQKYSFLDNRKMGKFYVTS